ncbi:MAG: DUF2007 domain-containing protein [Halioglobus sp.]
MKLVYTHENRLLVENARNILEAKNIEVVLKNEFAQGALGEAAPIETWLELWVVDDGAYPLARQIIGSSLSPADAPEWVCPRCKEHNDAAFELCWNCQTESPRLRDQ